MKKLFILFTALAMFQMSFAQEQSDGGPDGPVQTSFDVTESFYFPCEGTTQQSLMINTRPDCPPDEICVTIYLGCGGIDPSLIMTMESYGYTAHFSNGFFSHFDICMPGAMQILLPIEIPCNCQVTVTLTQYFTNPCPPETESIDYIDIRP